jgi:sortase A
MEGTGASALNAGIGHITETAGIGEKGNCVLCGHNGSRRGTFFTPLSQAAIGDDVTILDKNGETHIYEITDSFVVDPYDNSIKTQTGEEELTLFTCAQKGTMRYVVKCVPKEAVDE